MKAFSDEVKVSINPIEQEKIWWYVDKCDKEISGLGKVVRLDDGSLYVDKIYLLEQECTAVETELDDEAIAQLLYDTRNDDGEMLFWWHSHVDMGVTWSGTDYDTMEQLGKAGMILCSVYNKRRQSRTALYMAEQGEYMPSVFMDDLTLTVETILTAEEVTELTSEYDDKVSFPVYQLPNRSGHSKYYQGDNGFSGPFNHDTPLSDKEDKKFIEEAAGITGDGPKISRDEPQSMALLFDGYSKMTHSDKQMFMESYETWTGQTPNMTDQEVRRDYFEFCEYYDFDADKLGEDYGYGYDWQGAQ